MTIYKKIFSLVFFILLISTCTNAQNNGYYEDNHNGKIENNYSSQDSKKAMHFKLEAEKGDAASQCNYGICLINGKGVNKNLKEAAYWFKKSAEQGNAKGQLNYGVCLLKGIGIEKNDKEASKWLKKSAEQGNEKAQKLYSSLLKNVTNSEKKNIISDKKSTETKVSKDISNTIDTKTKNESTNLDNIEEIKMQFQEMENCWNNMIDLRNAIQRWNYCANKFDSSKERMDENNRLY